MKIAIAGCGIAGTAIAYCLARLGHKVTIFEQAAECKSIGAGILLQPSGQVVLKRLGLLEQIAERSASLDGLEAVLANGRRLVRLRYADRRNDRLGLGVHCQGLGVHRGLLFQSLLERALSADVSVVNDARVVSYECSNQSVQISTANGDHYSGFDLLVAADGSNSALRTASGIACSQVEYDYAALWSTGATSAVTDRLLQIVDGTSRLVGLLPIGDGRCSFFWGLPAAVLQSTVDRGLADWKVEVLELCPLAAEILEGLSSFDQLTFARYRHVRMRRWHGPGILFVGDAAHPSSPHLGQGVNLALEDAICFADCLDAKRNAAAAASAYQRQRWRKVRYYQQLTRLLTPFFQSGSSLLACGRDICLPWFPRIPFVRSEMIRTLCGEKEGWLS